MSEENKIQNEEELWDLLSGELPAAPKAEKKSKPAGKFENPVAKPRTAPAAAAPAAPKEAAPGEKRKLDGFFFGCMAGVAAISIAATLMITGIPGTNTSATVPVKDPEPVTTPIVEEDDSRVEELELENAELRAQIALQKTQIMDLQAQLIEAVGSEEYLSTMPTNPEGEVDDHVMTDQMKAYDIFNRIKDAYTNFDRDTIEELIPQMDAMLTYLSSDALNEYYLILEYVEQPSNG